MSTDLYVKELKNLIFFDESGKKDQHPILMGALSIPTNIYARKEFIDLKGTKTHWANLAPKNAIKDLINTLAKFEEVVKFNIINYDYVAIEKAASKFSAPKDKEFIERTIYAKFPERIFYGLLRNGVKHIEVSSEVVIEKATEYEKYVVDLVENHLNVQSLYRGEHFKVEQCLLKSKGEDVGLEITDLILGIVRTIIKNEPQSKGPNQRKRISLVIDLLKNQDVYNLFSTKIMFFEWTRSNELKERNFNDYLRSFISENENIWFSME